MFGNYCSMLARRSLKSILHICDRRLCLVAMPRQFMTKRADGRHGIEEGW